MRRFRLLVQLPWYLTVALGVAAVPLVPILGFAGYGWVWAMQVSRIGLLAACCCACVGIITTRRFRSRAE